MRILRNPFYIGCVIGVLFLIFTYGLESFIIGHFSRFAFYAAIIFSILTTLLFNIINQKFGNIVSNKQFFLSTIFASLIILIIGVLLIQLFPPYSIRDLGDLVTPYINLGVMCCIYFIVSNLLHRVFYIKSGMPK
jgi:hypothetical protein